MKWTIDKSFDWCYGHRVWSQALNEDFTGSEGACLACRHLHGHQGKLKVLLQGDGLENGMVTDFKHLGWMKDFIDDVLDHKMIMDIHDPLISHEVPELCAGDDINLGLCNVHDEGYYTPGMVELTKAGVSDAVYEKYEGMVFVDFVPTSENLAAWLLGIARKKMAKLGVDVVAVEFWETPKSHCRVDI